MALKGVSKGVIIGVFVTVIGGILLLLLSNFILDIINTPHVLPVAKDNEQICPSRISFSSWNEGITTFSLQFQNSGDDGTLYSTLSSSNLLIRSDNLQPFSNNSIKIWVVGGKKYQEFNFEIKLDQNSTQKENLTTFFNYGCYKEVMGYRVYCKEYNGCCRYKQETSYSSTHYILSNTTC